MGQRITQLMSEIATARSGGRAVGPSADQKAGGAEAASGDAAPFAATMAVAFDAADADASGGGERAAAGECRASSDGAQVQSSGDSRQAAVEAAAAGPSPTDQIVQALLGLAADVQAGPVQLPARIDPTNVAQVARIIAEILHRGRKPAGEAVSTEGAPAAAAQPQSAERQAAAGTVVSPATDGQADSSGAQGVPEDDNPVQVPGDASAAAALAASVSAASVMQLAAAVGPEPSGGPEGGPLGRAAAESNGESSSPSPSAEGGGSERVSREDANRSASAGQGPAAAGGRVAGNGRGQATPPVPDGGALRTRTAGGATPIAADLTAGKTPDNPTAAATPQPAGQTPEGENADAPASTGQARQAESGRPAAPAAGVARTFSRPPVSSSPAASAQQFVRAAGGRPGSAAEAGESPAAARPAALRVRDSGKVEPPAPPAAGGAAVAAALGGAAQLAADDLGEGREANSDSSGGAAEAIAGQSASAKSQPGTEPAAAGGKLTETALFDPAANAERIVRAISGQFNGRTVGSLRLHLDPPGLGEIRIEMSFASQSVRITLMPANESTAQLLGGQLHLLRAGLESRGLSVGQLNVDSPRVESSAFSRGQQAAGDPLMQQQPSDGRAGQGAGRPFAQSFTPTFEDEPLPAAANVTLLPAGLTNRMSARPARSLDLVG